MRRISGALAAGIVTILLASASLPARADQGNDQTVLVPDDDSAMNAAIARAQASLPEFWQAFGQQAAGTSRFSLKVGITGNGITEHFWTRDIERSARGIHATIANEPAHVTTVTYGQRIRVNEADISDWMFYRNGKVVGGETIRVLLEGMSPQERAAYGLEFERD